MRYIVCGKHYWNRDVFNELRSIVPGAWMYIESPGELETNLLEDFDPDYIFFLHWSYLVPNEIVNTYECICFHPTDLPFGRGASPIQHLIQMGFKETILTAFRMTPELDAGPIYIQERLSLEGSLREIFIREMHIAFNMILDILENPIHTTEQVGEPTYFKRRKPYQSEILTEGIDDLYDHIRMLDATGYPPAFINYLNYRLEFKNAILEDGTIRAEVVISEQ